MPNAADPLITRIEPLRPRGLKVLVHTDSGEPFEIMLEALERSRLGVGDRLPSDSRQHLLKHDGEVRVRDAAFNLLSYRARTRTELKRRLRQKGFTPEAIDLCLDRLQERGFLDDQAVAAAFVRDRLRHRPRGRRRLSSELRAKGVPTELANSTIEQVFKDEAVDDSALAKGVVEAWLRRQNQDVLDALADEGRSPEREKARRRLYGHLTRRGFGGTPLQEAMADAAEMAGD